MDSAGWRYHYVIKRFCLTKLVVFLFALPAFTEDADHIELWIVRNKIYFTEPVNDDGTIDYVAALNAH